MVQVRCPALWVVALLASCAWSQQASHPDVPYGDHERQQLDFYRAPGEDPQPVLLYIHGGGFVGGSRDRIPQGWLEALHAQGIAVASMSYRLAPEFRFPSQFEDGARAVQFLRSQAEVWRIDPARIAVAGGSAGAGMALWLAFRDDLAQADTRDPVARLSSRVACAVVIGAQTSYDPRWIQQHIGGRAHEHPSFAKVYAPELLADPDRAAALFAQVSPLTWVSDDDAPVLMFYNELGELAEDARPGVGIHHINFGIELQAALDPLGVPCLLRQPADYAGNLREAFLEEMLAFLSENL